MSGFDFDDVPNWRGRDVIDQNGLAVGVISDIYVDDVTGRPEWAGVKPGLFSHRLTFVPLSQATLHGLRVQVPYHQSHIHEAPNIHPDGHLTADEEAPVPALRARLQPGQPLWSRQRIRHPGHGWGGRGGPRGHPRGWSAPPAQARSR